MEQNNKYSDRVLWLYEHSQVIFIVVLLVLGTVGLGGAFFLDNRLSDIENRLDFAPPRSYAAPDLEQYASDGVTADQLTNRHTVYVPVYSHIYYRGGAAYPLEATLSIRNVDMSNPIYVESVEYYDTNGKLSKRQVDQLIKLDPLQTLELLIEGRDSTGGSGANFLVRWGTIDATNKPLIETVMVGTAGTQGISFGRSGIEITTSASP